MYYIADYDKRYRPYDKSGGELRKADWVKLPVKPRGEGLAELFEYKRGLEVFGIWCLLLEKATKESAENRGKLLNHKGEPANIEQIAKGISLKKKTKLVEHAISILLQIGWVKSDNRPEESSATTEECSPKSRVEYSRVEKSKYMDFVLLTSEEHKKLINRYGEANTRKLIGNLNRYIGSTGKRYKSHYYTLLNFAKRDNLPELKQSEEDAEAEQQALENKRQEMRKEYGDYYNQRTTDQLRELRKSGHLINHRWLIDEILRRRQNEANP